MQEHTLSFLIQMMMKMKKTLLFLTCCTFGIVACNKEPNTTEPEQPATCHATYVADIKTIVNTKCAISGCHDGNSGIIGFNTYIPLKERADNGRIKSYVIELKIMPPSTAKQLTDDEKKLIQCWLDNGAPEN